MIWCTRKCVLIAFRLNWLLSHKRNKPQTTFQSNRLHGGIRTGIKRRCVDKPLHRIGFEFCVCVCVREYQEIRRRFRFWLEMCKQRRVHFRDLILFVFSFCIQLKQSISFSLNSYDGRHLPCVRFTELHVGFALEMMPTVWNAARVYIQVKSMICLIFFLCSS